MRTGNRNKNRNKNRNQEQTSWLRVCGLPGLARKVSRMVPIGPNKAIIRPNRAKRGHNRAK